MEKPILLLLQQDLRLNDNPALHHACQTGLPIIPIYILDDLTPGEWKMGDASRAWLHYSLNLLADTFAKKGSKLHFFKGKSIEVIEILIKKYNIDTIYCNRAYEPYFIKRGQMLKQLVPNYKSFKANLLHEPWEIFNKQNQPFQVYTPFWKKCLEISFSEVPFPVPKTIPTYTLPSETLESFELMPKGLNWAENMMGCWKVGEQAAMDKLSKFKGEGIISYDQDRNIPSVDGTSILSPHLHFGEISPKQVYHFIKDHPHKDKFLSEIGWREFAYYQLYHYPCLPEDSWKKEFNDFPWKKNEALLKKWQKGETGYPIVDAGMRQLWQTGWMHNRVRMITASFLIKDLFIHWKEGAQWFWDTLVDADLANNSASWQWVAGCGFDAAPFFRIFNPILQGQKFDPDGAYIKKWVPELRRVPSSFIHEPWEYCSFNNIDYPEPIVDHDKAKKIALEAFKNLRKNILEI